MPFSRKFICTLYSVLSQSPYDEKLVWAYLSWIRALALLHTSVDVLANWTKELAGSEWPIRILASRIVNLNWRFLAQVTESELNIAQAGKKGFPFDA